MVNIENIDYKTEKNEDIIKEIFKEQKKLIEKYNKIENIPNNININLAKHQKILKEFTFRGIEELAEAYEAISDKNEVHFLEEISDSMHFFTELIILAGLDYDDVNTYDNKLLKLDLYPIDMEKKLWETTYYFSIACNLLKCKPWKKTQILTDIDKYKKRIIKAYNKYLLFLSEIGISSNLLLEIYMKKNKVNKFRIKTRY